MQYLVCWQSSQGVKRMLAGEHNLSWLERIFVGVMSTLMAAGITWTAVTVTEILSEQAAQAEKITAVLYRVSRIEKRLQDRTTTDQATRAHEEINRVNIAQDNRLDDHEKRIRVLESK